MQARYILSWTSINSLLNSAFCLNQNFRSVLREIKLLTVSLIFVGKIETLVMDNKYGKLDKFHRAIYAYIRVFIGMQKWLLILTSDVYRPEIFTTLVCHNSLTFILSFFSCTVVYRRKNYQRSYSTPNPFLKTIIIKKKKEKKHAKKKKLKKN